MAYPVSWIISFIAYLIFLKIKRDTLPDEDEVSEGDLAPDTVAWVTYLPLAEKKPGVAVREWVKAFIRTNIAFIRTNIHGK